MTFTIGIFDLFTYAIPGSLYVALVTYMSLRLQLTTVDELASSMPTALLIIVVATASYVLGHVSYSVGLVVDKVLPLWRRESLNARKVFAVRMPGCANSAILRSGYGLLRAAVEMRDREVAAEITRLRAVGLMLRNLTVPLVLAFVLAVVEAALGGHRVEALTVAAVALLAASGAAWRSFTLRHWSDLKTLEVCFWIPDLNQTLEAGMPTDETPPPRY
ncbi:MAG TPA: hypothetical protein VFM55_15285 [Micromonosporaceae bacterium]|nr:hypothetical protein [Micromonosporaceae bacterium]